MTLFGPLLRRSISYQDVWGSGDEWKDMRLTSAEAALGVTAVLASVDLIASRVQMMTIHEVRDTADGLEETVPLGPLLTAPSSMLAADEWIYQACASYLLFGRVAGYVTSRGPDSWPRSVEWLHPDKLVADTTSSAPRWSYNGQRLDPFDVIVRRWAPMIPGDVYGVSPVSKLHVDIQRALKAALYERDFFDAGGLPLAVLRNQEQDITQDIAEAAAGRYDAARRARGRRPLVLGKQWMLDTVTASPAENGVDATDPLGRDVVHGGESGGSLTYDNPEMNTRLLDGMALQPVYTMLERLISSTCLPRPRRLRFDPDSILRSDPKTAAEIDERLIRSGMSTPNERRRVRGLPPLDTGGDVALWPPYSTSMPADNVRDATPVVNVDARSEHHHQHTANVDANFEQMRFDMHTDAPVVNVDARSEHHHDAPVVNVEPAQPVEARSVTKRIEHDEHGRITAIHEETT